VLGEREQAEAHQRGGERDEHAQERGVQRGLVALRDGVHQEDAVVVAHADHEEERRERHQIEPAPSSVSTHTVTPTDSTEGTSTAQVRRRLR
jgi:hypothetical protein